LQEWIPLAVNALSFETLRAVPDATSTPVHDKQAEVITMNALSKEEKEIIGEAARIEGEAPVLTVHPLKADPETPGGSLVVKIRSHYPWRDEMPDLIEEDLPNAEPYDDPVEVTVELTKGKGTATFGDSKYTVKGGEGQVSWDQIPAGDYTITVSVPEGFRLDSYSVTEGDEAAKLTEVKLGDRPLVHARVSDEETTTVEVFLLPLLSAVDVNPFFDQDRSGNPTNPGQTSILGLKANFRLQGKPLVASCVTEVFRTKGKKPQTKRVDDKHIGQYIFRHLRQSLESHPDHSRVYVLWHKGKGTVSVVTDPSVQVTLARQGTLALRAESPDGTFVYLEPGRLVAANIPYEESQAEIQVAAFLEEDLACDPCCAPASGRPATKKVPLPNVTFQLYLGSPQGEPYREATTVGSAPHIFSNLPAGNYTVIASNWPTTFAGRSQIQPRWPARGILRPLSVSAGPPTKIEFCFGPCLSKVIGIVTEGQAGTGVPGVPLTLVPSGGKGSTYHATSESTGEYEFNDVKAGDYVLRIEREKIALTGGKTLEVPASAQAGYPISVPACGTASAPVFQLDEDVHKVFGTATAPDGSVLQYLRVEIQDKAGNILAVTQTDQNGHYECILPQSGFYLVVPQINGVPQIPVQVNSEQKVDISASPRGTPASPQAAARSAQVSESEIDLQAYPVLTEEVPSEVVSRPPGGGGGSGVAPIGQLAENAIRDVLSWRTKTNDPKAFVMALNQSFKLTETEGHTEFAWTPRTYTVQTDMGAITGAQASIYTRAKVALDQSLPLLDGLYSLMPEIAQEDLDSKREVVRSLYTELVNDLGIEGGPRVPRVDQLFALLLGTPLPTDPEKAGGELGDLRDRFALERDHVVTIEDEQNLTNYVVLVDYIIGLSNSWNAQKGYFTRNGGPEPYFGTQLVLLSRALDVVAQSVRDVYFAMDSVFLTAAERQTILLDFSSVPGGSSLFVAELMDWVERAASDELPRQLQGSGKDAIDSMGKIVDTLGQYVRAAMVPPQPTNGLPPGYRTPRVQRALKELAEQLKETLKLTKQVKAPKFPID
jgi:hypothetical protein